MHGKYSSRSIHVLPWEMNHSMLRCLGEGWGGLNHLWQGETKHPPLEGKGKCDGKVCNWSQIQQKRFYVLGIYVSVSVYGIFSLSLFA